MSNLVGRVHFNATMDGRNMPKDAERIGKQAGLKGGQGFSEQWDKEFRKGLTQQGQAQLAHWQRRGKADGLAYGRGLEIEFQKFSRNLNRAFDNFQGLNVDASFMDDWIGRSEDWENRVRELQDQLGLLNRQGAITDKQFAASSGTIDRWVASQRSAAEESANLSSETERQREQLAQLTSELEQHARARENVLRVERDHARSLDVVRGDWVEMTTLIDRLTLGVDHNGDSVKTLGDRWKNLSHNQRQWTAIIGAVIAALPELAGLSSAAGSGLLTLGGGLTGGAIGLGTLITSIVQLNGDLEELPPSLRAARAGLDDFKASAGELADVIALSALQESEDAWRSLGSTVRGLSPYFATVGKAVGEVLDELATGLAPGTENFDKLARVVSNAAPQFQALARTTGRLGEGLLSAFSNPQMERSIRELLGWLDEVADGFADFTEGDSFDDWLRHGRAVFGEFGELLETTGGLLNDLVTPASINRLTEFMDNIGVFLDTGGRGILEFADGLNVFGLAAELLADLGEALEPIAEPMAEIGEELNRLVGGGIEGAAMALGAMATAAAPVAEALGDILGAIPTEALTILGGVAVGTAGAFATLRGIQGMQGVIEGMRGISTESGKTVGALGRIGRGAGLIGAGVVGVLALSDGLEQLHRQMTDVDGEARRAVAGTIDLGYAYDELGRSAFGMSYGLTDASGALDMVNTVGSDLSKFFPTFAATFSDTGRQASQLAATLGELDTPIADLANVSVAAASEKFQSLVSQLGATDAQAMNMLDSMPQFREVLEAVALQTGELGTDQDLLALAMGRANVETRDGVSTLIDLDEQAGLTKQGVDDLAAAIRGFGSETLSSRDANRQFEQAFDDLTQSLIENGTELDVGTEKGRANEAALDDLAKAGLELVATTLERTDSEEEATAAMQRARDALIEQYKQFGHTQEEAEAYADMLGLIPDDITSEGNFIADNASVDRWNERLASIKRSIVTSVSVGGAAGQFVSQRRASGGIVSSERQYTVGEAGIEAIVPLQRALSQVSPDVRWLSAIAQGKSMPNMPGGESGGRGDVNFMPGAIVVQGAVDPRRTALEVADEVAARVAS